MHSSRMYLGRVSATAWRRRLRQGRRRDVPLPARHASSNVFWPAPRPSSHLDAGLAGPDAQFAQLTDKMRCVFWRGKLNEPFIMINLADPYLFEQGNHGLDIP